MNARSDKELGELTRAVGSSQNRSREARPESSASVLDEGEGSRGSAGEGVVDGGGEAGPEVGGLLGGGVWEGGGRGGGENGDEFGLGVVWELQVWDEGGSEEVGGRRGYDEDGC